MTAEQIPGRLKLSDRALPGAAKAEFWLDRRGDRLEVHQSFSTPSNSGSGGGAGWYICDVAGCVGERLNNSRQCFAHSDPQTRSAFLQWVRHNSDKLSFNGTLITRELWDEIKSSPVFERGSPVTHFSFVAAEISTPIQFSRVPGVLSLDLTAASVFEHIEIRNCEYLKSLVARYAFFNAGALNCHQSHFSEDVDISFARSERVSISFEGCEFARRFIADGVESAIHGGGATFRGAVSIRHSKAFVIFPGATIQSAFDVHASDFVSIQAKGATFDLPLTLGPFSTGGVVLLSDATFKGRVSIDVKTKDSIDLTGAALLGGGLIEIGAKTCRLGQCRIAGALRVVGKTDSGDLTEIQSLVNADAGCMSFAYVDMSKCSFFGAHGLGSIELESSVRFAEAAFWRGGRQFIADEFAWRSGKSAFYSAGWNLPGVVVGSEMPARQKGMPPPILIRALRADQVAAIYRELRRSIEGRSNMSGAAPFYFGEMEMRRWSAPIPERILLWAYFLLSGYGMRAWRAVATWGATVAVSATLMTLNNGFDATTGAQSLPQREYFLRSILFSTRATLPGVTTLEKLTPAGQLIELLPRVIGPLALGLFLLAVRAKLMRKAGD